MRRSVFSALLAASVLIATSRSEALDETSERAELLEAARLARNEGKHQQALDKALRAARIKTTAALLRFVAEEYVELGTFHRGYRVAEQCLVAARKEPASENRDAVVTGCGFLVGQLRDRVAIIEVQLRSQRPPDLRITVAGEEPEDGRNNWVVAPGEIEIQVRADGFKPFEKRVEARPGSLVALPIELEPISKRSAVVAALPFDDVSESGEAREPKMAKWPGIVLIGAGAAGLAVAGVSALAAQSRYSAADEICPERSNCLTKGRELKDSVTTFDTLTLVSAITGVVLVGTGTTWLVVRANRDDKATTAGIQLTVSGF